LGVYLYKEKFYVLNEACYVEEFCRQPEFYIEHLKRVCRRHPELIHLLRLQDEF